MAKFSGQIGFAVSTQTAPDVWQDVITKKIYLGDVLRKSQRSTNDQKVNDDMVISHRISIIADEFVNANLGVIKFVVYNGVFWKVGNIEIERPRIILTLGSVYNGPKG